MNYCVIDNTLNPITPDQYIGDTLSTFNKNFSALDSTVSSVLDWQDVITTISNLSADWNDAYALTSFLALSGSGNVQTLIATISSQPYAFFASISSIAPVHGNHTQTGMHSTIGGGLNNTAQDNFTTVSGGYQNTASACYAVVVGGTGNTASECFSNVTGGCSNTARGIYSFVSNGCCNTASGYSASVLGGLQNKATGTNASVLGGLNNCASGAASVIVGGNCNNTNYKPNVFILGNCIMASKPNFTYVENLSSLDRVYGTFYGDGSNLCNVSINVCTMAYTSNLQSNSIHPNKGNNTVAGRHSLIAGGVDNNILGDCASILGGSHNHIPLKTNNVFVLGSNITATESHFTYVENLSANNKICGTFYGDGSNLTNVANQGYTLSGKENNNVLFNRQNNTTSGYYSNILGGCDNKTLAAHSNIINGNKNTVSSCYANVLNGLENCVAADSASIITGNNNTITSTGNNSAILGGSCNTVSGAYSLLASGINNTVCSCYAAVITGNGNTASGYNSFIGFGSGNNTTGCFTSVLGGASNTASHAYSSIIGGKNNVAQHRNTFILGSNIKTVLPGFTYVNNLELSDAGSALILKDPNGKRWKLGVNINGELVSRGEA